MSPEARIALIGIAASLVGNLLFFSFWIGVIWWRVRSHGELLGKLPCLQPFCRPTQGD